MQREKPSSTRAGTKTESSKKRRDSVRLPAGANPGSLEGLAETCEACGSQMARKFGRFGEFLACANYPKCKTTRDLAKIRARAGEELHSEAREELCGDCGRPMTIRSGRYGQFLACTGYPECRTTRRIQTGEKFARPQAAPDERCPLCAERLILKQGRNGPFTACSHYPKCKYVKQETTGVSCPKCGAGELVVKNSNRGAFYGCANYPACKFTLRDRPVPLSCPECGARFVVERLGKDGSRELQCRTENCKFKKASPDASMGEP